MDDQNLGGPRPGDAEGGLSPVRAFLILGAVLAATTVWFFATREPTPASPTAEPSRSPDYSLTDAEAIAEFERLNERRVAAYKLRDISLLHEIVAPQSPLLAQGEKEIRQLLREGVLLRSRFTIKSIAVVTNNSEEIVIRQTEVEHPKFLDESGREITADRAVRERVIDWSLHRLGSEWWIFDSSIVSERRVR